MKTKLLLSLFSVVALVAFAVFGVRSTLSSPSAIVPIAHAAAVDYFLKIEGVDGESTDDSHRGEIEINSFSWGASQAGIEQMSFAGAGGGRGVGKVSVHDISITKSVDKATPVLMLSSAVGTHYPRVVLSVRKAGGDQQQEYFKVTLTDVMVSSYQLGGSQGTVPTDNFSLNFSKIEFEYRPQSADGSLGAPVKAGYDVKANKKV